MARKRLSDLLREEAKKTSTGEASSPAGESETKSHQSSHRAKQANSENESSDSSATASPTTIDVPAQSVPIASDESTTSLSSTSHLEETIAQLQVALEQERQTAQQQQVQLQQEITQLKSEQQQQADRVKSLELEVKQSQQLKTELEEAKKLILQLSESNQQLQAKKQPVAVAQPRAAQSPSTPSPLAPAHSAPPAALKPLPPPPAPEPGLESNPQSNSGKSQPAAGIVPMPGRDRPIHELALRKILDHPTRPGALPTMSSEPPEYKEGKLSETDMGWVD